MKVEKKVKKEMEKKNVTYFVLETPQYRFAKSSKWEIISY